MILITTVAAFVAFIAAVFVLEDFPPAAFFSTAVITSATAVVITAVATVAARVLDWASQTSCTTWGRSCHWATWLNNSLTWACAHRVE